ncbi:MAG: hypothetical protein A4E28_02663 [Methanocella sp. PtaU1.Bin125]|nr:MAG: hypothetical protein A4E28_02663 [Methanocella sp. PtaU1.Bin125]
MARQTRLHEHGRRPGKAPDEDKETYTPPREELGTSDEIVQQGRQFYAFHQIPDWPQADSARQYIATPDGMQEMQHGVVTWVDSARANPREEDIERKHEPGHRKRTTKPPEYEL